MVTKESREELQQQTANGKKDININVSRVKFASKVFQPKCVKYIESDQTYG